MENWNERKLKWEHWCFPMRAWSSAALLWLKAVSGLFSLHSWVRGCYAAGYAKSEPKLPVSSTSPCLTPSCYLSHFSPGKQNSSITLGITSYSELLILGMWIWDTSWNYFLQKCMWCEKNASGNGGNRTSAACSCWPLPKAGFHLGMRQELHHSLLLCSCARVAFGCCKFYWDGHTCTRNWTWDWQLISHNTFVVPALDQIWTGDLEMKVTIVP